MIFRLLQFLVIYYIIYFPFYRDDLPFFCFNSLVILSFIKTTFVKIIIILIRNGLLTCIRTQLVALIKESD